MAGRKILVLTIIDTCCGFSPAIVLRSSFRAPDVVEVLKPVRDACFPKIRVDQGRDFALRDLDLRAYQRNVTLDWLPAPHTHGNAYSRA